MIHWAFEREMNTATPPTIDKVRRFWNSQPLGLGYVRGEIGSAMRTAGAITPGRGRESMPNVKTADDFVRMYDGAGNPIGKAYTKRELRQAFGRFQSIEFHRYF